MHIEIMADKALKLGCLLFLFTGAIHLSGAEMDEFTNEELQKMAAAGGLPARIELAHRQLNGSSNDFDQKFILDAFQRGVKAGDAKSHTGLGLCHLWAVGMDFDRQAGTEHLEKAAEMGDPQGTFHLGVLYLQRSREMGNSNKGVELCNKAAELGSLDAKSLVAIWKVKGEGVPADPQGGLAELNELFEKQGNASAGVHLANYYRHNKQDLKRAEMYYQKAAEKNHAGAMVALGDMAMNNGGWKGDRTARKKAETWYRKAIARNSRTAMRKLAMMQKRDTSVRRQGEDWYQLLLEASRKGDSEAILKLADVHYHAPGYTFRDLDWSKTVYFSRKYMDQHPYFFYSYLDNEAGSYATFDRLLDIYLEGGHGVNRDYDKCLEIAAPYLGLKAYPTFCAGRILLLPDAPKGNSREHFIRGYACVLTARRMNQSWLEHLDKAHPNHQHQPLVSDELLFVLRSRHGMTRDEVARAEQLSKEGFPNPQTPLLP